MTSQFTKLDLINFSENAYNPVDNPELPTPDGYQRLDMPIDATETIDGKEVKIYGNEGFKGAAY